MSARPDVRRLSGDELDLLISRSLDEDLPPEDQKLLEEILASDPHAAARHDELAGVVAALAALPAPGAPLGMAARIAATASERSSGLAGVWQRIGIFPPPAMVRGAAAVFAIVVIGISVMRSQGERAKQYEQMEATAVAKSAERSENSVSVFFQEKEKKQALDANEAGAPAAPKADAKVAPGPAGNVATNVPAKAPALLAAPPAAEAGKRAQVALGAAAKDQKSAGVAEADNTYGKTEVLEERQAASSSDSAVSLRDDAVAKRAKVNREMAAKEAVAQVPPSVPAAAPAALSPPPLAWSVSVLGSPGWMLKKAPDSVPGRLFSARCFVSVDASGRVTAVRPFDAPLPKEVDDLVRGLVFVPVAAGGRAQVPADVEIEVRAR